MALDVGDVRVGIAVCDALRIVARPLRILDRSKCKAAEAIAALAREEETPLVVVGLPRNMDGTIGFQAAKAQAFAEKLRHIAPKLQIEFWDERMTSRQSEAVLRETKARKSRRMKPKDDVAAALILEAYLDHLRFRKP